VVVFLDEFLLGLDVVRQAAHEPVRWRNQPGARGDGGLGLQRSHWETCGLSRMYSRQGMFNAISSPCTPRRGPMAIASSGIRVSPSKNRSASGAHKSAPSNRRSMSSAWHRRAGPLVRGRSGRPPRSSRILSMPSSGSSARTSTAAGNPSRSVTMLKQ
jgi:hypothetical protein